MSMGIGVAGGYVVTHADRSGQPRGLPHRHPATTSSRSTSPTRWSSRRSFAFIITSISGFYGYYADGNSLEVGRASTKAVVVSSIVILIFNLILTQVLLDIT